MEISAQQKAGTSLLNDIREALPDANMSRIEQAVTLCEERCGKTPHIFMDMTFADHARGVTRVALQYAPDEDTVIASLLQHALKCEHTSLQDLEDTFGPRVRGIVSSLHLLSHLNTADKRHSMEDLRIMLVSVSDDIGVVFLKLCARAYILDQMEKMSSDFRVRICRETLQLFAPVAARLGIYQLKHVLENKSFPIVYPVEYDNIINQIDAIHTKHGVFLDRAREELQKFFTNEKLSVQIKAREKLPYSVFLKQKRKSLTAVEDIYDLFALRVLVDTEAQCYQALGLLHRAGTPLAHRFKDYISFPKPNGYQSLHTCLMRLPGCPPDLQVEVQIRTHAMQREAEYGIAAHWSYKEGGAIERNTNAVQLQKVLQRQQVLSGDDDDVSHDHNTYSDNIYVLTPKGNIIELPEDATPLDFAFAIHTDVGLTFKSAKVNNAIVPLDHKLENGDVVEVQTTRNPQPSQRWLQSVRTSSARSKLRAYFASLNRDVLIARGRSTLNAELQARDFPALDPDYSVLKTFKGEVQSMHQREDILMKLGQGSVRPSSVLRHLDLPREWQEKEQKVPERTSRHEHIVEVEGGVAMPIRFAKCCQADMHPGNPPIVGFVTRAGHVSVHRKECGMLRNANPERKITVRWR